jgi:hypothetical protein
VEIPCSLVLPENESVAENGGPVSLNRNVKFSSKKQVGPAQCPEAVKWQEGGRWIRTERHGPGPIAWAARASWPMAAARAEMLRGARDCHRLRPSRARANSARGCIGCRIARLSATGSRMPCKKLFPRKSPRWWWWWWKLWNVQPQGPLLRVRNYTSI